MYYKSLILIWKRKYIMQSILGKQNKSKLISEKAFRLSFIFIYLTQSYPFFFSVVIDNSGFTSSLAT